MNTPCITSAACCAFAISVTAFAQPPDARHGDHPAVVVQRLQAQAGYDYASKFYPHPAWLYLRSEAPRPMLEHPAVVVFKRRQHEQAAAAATNGHEQLAATGR